MRRSHASARTHHRPPERRPLPSPPRRAHRTATESPRTRPAVL